MINTNYENNEEDNDLLDDLDNFENENLIVERKIINIIYDIFIDDEIIKPAKYRKIYKIIKYASKNDTINLIINTSGGCVSTFIELYDVLIKTKAKTIAEIHIACSAGSLLSLSCDQIKLNEYAEIMIHSTFSSGLSGKIREMKAYCDFENKQAEKICKKIYKGFLTEEEIEKVLDGKDYYFNAEQIKKRLKNWIPIRKRIIK